MAGVAGKEIKSDSILTSPEAVQTEQGCRAYWDVLVSNLVCHFRYYSPFVSITSVTFTKKIPWMGIRWMGDSLDLHLNPDKLTLLTMSQQLEILKHEFAHYFLRHLGTARESKLKDAIRTRSGNATDMKVHQFSNILFDLEINSILTKANLPSNCAFPSNYGLPDNLLAEEYLALIKDDELTHIMKEKVSQVNIQSSAGSCKGEESGCGGGDGSCKGDESGCGGGDGEEKSRTPRDLRDFMSPDSFDVLLDGVPMDNLDEAEIEDRLKKAGAAARGGLRGSAPGGFELLLEKLRPPKIQWKGFFKETTLGVLRTSNSNPTYARLNRRGLAAPGKIYKSPPRLFVFLDTSGSISDTQLALLASEVKGLRRNVSDIIVLVCDAAVHDEYRFNGTFKTPKGGGGSSFTPAFELIRKKYPAHGKENVVLLLTDGDIDVPADAREKVIWVLVDGDREVPYGKKVLVPK